MTAGLQLSFCWVSLDSREDETDPSTSWFRNVFKQSLAEGPGAFLFS